MSDVNQPLCTHTLLENGVHVFELHAATRQTVDVLMQMLDQVVDTTPEGGTFYYIVDMRKHGMPPLQHFFQSGLNWVRQRKNLPKIRTVFITTAVGLASLGDTFAGIINRALSTEWQWKFFTEGGIDEASAWLLSR